MPLTLEQAKLATTDAVDLNAIDEFRVSHLLDLLPFDNVVAPTGGGTFVYGYTRLKEMSDAAFRAINSEYAPTEATKEQHVTKLKILGGAFQIDRQVAHLGTAAANNVAFQMAQKIKATRALFSDAVINGDSATEAESFDGLSKALAGTSTEVATGTYPGWDGEMTEGAAWKVLDVVDDLLGKLDGEATALIGNKAAINKIKAAARRASSYVTAPGPLGSIRDFYGNIALIDAENKPGTGGQVIPVTGGKTDLYAVRIGMDAFHGVSSMKGNLVTTYKPDFTSPGAVKTGEVEMGPVGVVLKASKGAAVARGLQVAPAA